ncbi:uncharacterized protein DFL_005141 [Arthrobotrys flagrans]|uniref:Uncharacterized protein n=1 Tax=Arthrobotrys flagrans TaxID=97331 RepID=A0A437A6Z2_ARTFL|nr:hypothetical protein DFL_005141 [Arthrobotrys flagrans]
MEASQDLQPSSSSSSPSSLPNNGNQPSASVPPPTKKPKREYNSKKRVEAYSASNKPAYKAVKEAAVESLLFYLNYIESTDEVWLRDVPKPKYRLVRDERPYYWAISGAMTPTEEKGWKTTIEKGSSGPSQTGSRWGTENLRILEGMIKSGLVRPFFADRPPKPGVCNIVAQGSSILGLGWGLVGDHEDPSTYDKEKYASKGIALLRDLPDVADRAVPRLSGGPEDEAPEGGDGAGNTKTRD